MAKTLTYTVWCRDMNGEGTIWIDTVRAQSLQNAVIKARRECARAWSYQTKHVMVIGIAEGDVKILNWDDEAGLI